MTALTLSNPDTDRSANVIVRVTDYDGDNALRDASADRRRQRHDAGRISTCLSSELTLELDGASEMLGLANDEILLAALGRTIARTIGEGAITVDLPGRGRFADSYPSLLPCVGPAQTTATEMLSTVHHRVNEIPWHARAAAHPLPEVLFAYVGAETDQSTSQAENNEALPGLRHPLELWVSRCCDVLQLDWWYDANRFEEYTVAELAEQFPLALIELTSEATPFVGVA